jgi:oxygen-independent coproporphyrinogen-3 oxidase
VPFCAHKCEYCAFYSEPSQGEVIERYVGALIRELELVHQQLKPTTVFFGGGTPSLLSVGQWRRILEAMERMDLLGAKEWTIESNPATVSVDKAKLWQSFGVNRVSMGVQSFDEDLLDRLGRIHSREMAFKSYDVLRQAGFKNVNIDLMFAIPGQTMEIWEETLRAALSLNSEHLSSYEVIYEEDTPLYAQLQAGEFSVDEDLACAMYDELVQTLGRAGFEQYEVANYARLTSLDAHRPAGGPAANACRHNINYWQGGSYFGLGPSAAGYVNGVRFKNWSNTQLYCEKLERGERPTESQEQLSPLRRAGETAAFGLRMNAGWDFQQFNKLTGFDLRLEWKTEMEKLISRDWAIATPERFHLTDHGLRFADAAAELFLR